MLRTAKDGHQAYCRDCTQAHNRKYRKEQPAKIQTLDRYRKYGLTVQAYDELLLQANGKCMACDRPAKLVVDHDHATNAVRGLLCTGCNLALGHVGDNIERLMSLVAYLSTRQTPTQTSTEEQGATP